MKAYIVLPVSFSKPNSGSISLIQKMEIIGASDPLVNNNVLPVFRKKVDALDHQIQLMDEHCPDGGSWEIFKIELITDKNFRHH